MAVSQRQYEILATFRRTVRAYLAFSEAEARKAGLTPRQHQALLAVRGTERGRQKTIGDLAEDLGIRHHSAVGLVNRLAALRLLARERSRADRRTVHVRLTDRGREALDRLTSVHQAELREVSPRLRKLLARLKLS